MEVADPFSPGYTNGHVDTFEDWGPGASAAAEIEPQAPRVDVSAGLGNAKALAAQLATVVEGLSQALEDAEIHRIGAESEREALQAQIQTLAQQAERKEQFRQVFLQGSGAALTPADLTSLQDVTNALTADPDRLTTLFAVVQQADKLATVVRVYTELRTLSEQG